MMVRKQLGPYSKKKKGRKLGKQTEMIGGRKKKK